MQYNEKIDGGKGFDWGLASADYARFRDIYPDEFYEKIASLNLCVKGQKCLDLGTGTGVLPRNMYKYGAEFTGADIAENQIKFARILSERENKNIDYVVSSAEDLTFPPESFDVVTACQCFMYFDKKTVLPKIYSLLKDNGHFAVLLMDWLPEESEIAKFSEDLVLKYNPKWTGGHMKRYELEKPDWAGDIFTVANAVTFDLNVHFTRESWHGRMKACRGIGASSLTQEEIEAWEREHIEFLQTVPPEFDIVHFASILDLQKKN